MKNQPLHPADKFVRWMLKSFPDAEQQMLGYQKIRSELSKDWPEWCYLPMAAVYAIITKGADIAIAQAIMAEKPDSLPKLTAALIWNRTKMVYKFDGTLSELLAKQSITDEIPIEVLYRLPYPCIFIESPGKLLGRAFDGYFAWLEFDVNNRMPELRLLYLMRDGGTVPYPLMLKGKTIPEFWKATEESARSRTSESIPDEVPAWPLYSTFASAVNHILYLCAENADVSPSAASVSTPKRSHGVPQEPQLWDVGMRVGAAVREYGSRQPGEEAPIAAGQEHASPRPHIRRAHWHAFWTGKRNSPDRQLTVHWLAPIPVNYEFVREDMPTVIKPVKP